MLVLIRQLSFHGFEFPPHQATNKKNNNIAVQEKEEKEKKGPAKGKIERTEIERHQKCYNARSTPVHHTRALQDLKSKRKSKSPVWVKQNIVRETPCR